MEVLGFKILNALFLLTKIPLFVVPLTLFVGNDVPDTGEPVCHQGEGQHQEGEDHSAVLRVTVNLLQQTCQAQ